MKILDRAIHPDPAKGDCEGKAKTPRDARRYPLEFDWDKWMYIGRQEISLCQDSKDIIRIPTQPLIKAMRKRGLI